MKWDFKMVVLIVEWSKFRGGLKAGFHCTWIALEIYNKIMTNNFRHNFFQKVYPYHLIY